MNIDLLIIITVILLSAFFSGTETAFTATRLLTLEVYNRHKRRGASSASWFYKRPNTFFTTTLVGNNLVAVIYSSVFALYLKRIGVPVEIIVVISPVILLLFGEIIPKSMARYRPEKWALWSAGFLLTGYYLMYPIIFIARKSSSVLLSIFGLKDTSKTERISATDLRLTWRELGKSGVVDKSEAEMLDRLMDLRTTRLSEIMTPRIQIKGLPISTSLEEVNSYIQSTGHSRIPIYEDDLDHIIGILHARDLFFEPENIKEMMKPAAYYPELMPAVRLIERFRRGGAGMIVVVDEHGGTAGIVTLEDLLETIVGEIDDEYDRKEVWGREVAKNAYLVSGDTKLDLIQERLNISFPPGDYTTIGGLIINHLGEIPAEGVQLELDEVYCRVASATDNRIKKVLVRKKKRDLKIQ